MLRFLRMPKTRIRNFVSYPPEQKFAVAEATRMAMSIALHPADASVGQIDVTVTSLPALDMNVSLHAVIAAVDTALAAPENLRFE